MLPDVSRRDPPPVDLTVHSDDRLPVAAERTNTIRLPSGDHAAPPIRTPRGVNAFACDRPADHTYR
jgi:hypothetical protein